MAALVSRISDAVMRVANLIIGSLIGLIVLITLAAVWWRYVLNAPLAWPEQVSRIFFVWVTFLGAAVLYRQRLHIAIDMFVLALPAGLKTLVFWFVEIAVLGFVLVLLVYGLKLSLDTLDQTFGALDISPASFYFAAPVSAAMMVLFFVEKLLDPAKREPGGIAGSH